MKPSFLPCRVIACVQDNSASSQRAASRNRCSEDPKSEQALRREVPRPTLYQSGCSLGRNPVTRITMTHSCNQCGYDAHKTHAHTHTHTHTHQSANFLLRTTHSVQRSAGIPMPTLCYSSKTRATWPAACTSRTHGADSALST